MKLSTRIRYALRATTELALRKIAENGGTRPVPLPMIAKRQDIPEQYLRQIVMPLKRSGIVKTVRGRSGGYLLGREPKDISALDVVRAMGKRLEPVSCVAESAACRHVGECPTHPLWCKLTDAMRQALSTTTLAQLAEMCPQRGCLALPQGHMFDI